jgi:hypothetical protein
VQGLESIRQPDPSALRALAGRLQRRVHEEAVHASPMFSRAHWEHNAGADWPHEPDDGSYTLFENCIHPDCRLVLEALVPPVEATQDGRP